MRVPKTTHKQLLENAQMDGVSLNTYINTAISEKIGRASFSNQRILELEQELVYYKFKDKLVDCLEKCLIYRHIRRFAD